MPKCIDSGTQIMVPAGADGGKLERIACGNCGSVVSVETKELRPTDPSDRNTYRAISEHDMPETRTDEEIREMFERAPYTYASAFEHLLGDGWHKDGWLVKNGSVTIDAKAWEIMWLDLAPDGEEREQRTVKIPTYASIGATVAIAKALHDLSTQN